MAKQPRIILERAARALHDRCAAPCSFPNCRCDGECESAMEAARIVVHALREMDEPMIQAMQRAVTGWPRRDAVIGQWHAAIDAILAERLEP